MAILKDISVIWSLVHTLVLFLFLFESRYPKKKTFILTLATMIPLIIINFFLFIVIGFEKYGTLMLLTLSLPSCIIFWFIAKYRGGRFLFTFCMVDTTVLEILYITNIINHYFTPDTYLVMFIVRMIAYPVIEFFAYKKLRPMFLEVQNHVEKGWGVFAIIGVSFYLAITLLMTYPNTIVERPEYIPVLAIMFILMPVIYLHIITTLRNQLNFYKMSEQDKIMKLQVANITTRMEEIGEANEAFRKERHNFRHKLKAIASLIDAGQFEELARVVDRFESDIQKTAVVKYCNIPIIDAVLSVYIRQAQKTNIDVKFGFAFPDSFEANDSELATALANAIENAINACEKLPEEERRIEIKVLSKPKFMIMVRNTFDGNVTFDKQGIPKTNEEGPGFGTRSIAAFCENVGGYCQFDAKDNIFSIYMHLK